MPYYSEINYVWIWRTIRLVESSSISSSNFANEFSSLKNHGISKVAIVSGLLNSEDPKDEAMIIIKELSHEN